MELIMSILLYFGTFVNRAASIKSECGFKLNTLKEVCEYKSIKDQESFYCIKQDNFDCGELGILQSYNRADTFLRSIEKPLFEREHRSIDIQGDFEYINVSTCTGFKTFNLHRPGLPSKLFAADDKKNIQLLYKKHSHPYVASTFCVVKDDSYMSNEIDGLAGGSNYVVVISLGQHFRPFPIQLFIRRVFNVHKAVERLLLRSPDIKVIIKAENTRELNVDVERFSDFHGYIQNLIVKDVFKDLPVGTVDAWDMTIAFNSYSVHPSATVVGSQLSMFLFYICS